MKNTKHHLAEFCDTTSCHGASQIFNDKYDKVSRIGMVVLLLASLTTAGANVVLSIKSYYNYPYHQTVTKIYTADKPFPSVSVCNTAPTTSSNMMLIYKKLVNTTATCLSKDTRKYHEKNKKYGGFPIMYDNVDGIDEYTWKKEDVIIDCKYDSQNCNDSKITEFTNPYYGRCFTFNMDNNALKKTGDENGLSLIMYSYTYSPSLEEQINESLTYSSMVDANSHGLRLTVHNEGEFVNPFVNSLKIAPGWSTSISVHPVKTRRLGPPFESNCTQKDYSENYWNSKPNCLRACEQSYVVDRCHCKDSDLPIHHHPQVPFCGNATAIENCTQAKWSNQVDCILKAKNEFQLNYHERCDCQEACEEYSFKLSQSAFIWPNNYAPAPFYKLYVENKTSSIAYKEMSKYSMKFKLSKKLINHHFAQVNVFFNNDEVEVITESAKYPNWTWSLLSEIGGHLGFWCGVSILTLTDALLFGLKAMLSGRKSHEVNASQVTTVEK